MTVGIGPRITRALESAHPGVFGAYAIFAAFSTYFCMYAFRKPFAAGTFEGGVEVPLVGTVDYKIVLIISQVFGYTLSKFAGIKVISEMTPERRAWSLLGAIGFAHAALFFFALIPAPYNAVCLFLNGLPLGMVWGLTFGFLEGRKVSEPLGVGLSASYIVASGAVKSVGAVMLEAGISELWMPFLVGLLFLPPMAFVVWMLRLLPPPTAADEAARTKRVPMDKKARRAFFLRYLPGLLPLTALYILLTAYRDFRDNFAVEIWSSIGFAEAPGVLATAELPIAFTVLVALGGLMLFRSNRVALIAVHVVMLGGTVLIGAATAMYQAGLLDPAWWMIAVGLGLYLAYVPYGCILFDRMIAALGVAGTAGFLIYVTDAFGYLGSVALLLYKNFGYPNLSWLDFFIGFSYATSIVCSALFLISTVYFAFTTPRVVVAATPEQQARRMA